MRLIHTSGDGRIWYINSGLVKINLDTLLGITVYTTINMSSFSLSYLQSLLYSATIGQITSALGYQHAIHPVLGRKSDLLPPSPAQSRTKKSEAPIPSRFTPKCQPLSTEIINQVNEYFLTHWPFKSEKARKKFVAAGFSYVTCLYFPMAKDDRIHFACRLLTLLFLIDGMSYSPGLYKNVSDISRSPRGHVI